ncbi:hypothetical protein Tco_1034180, partial [Tanacetum coccineum]
CLGFHDGRGVKVRLTVEIVGVVPINGNSSICDPNPNSFIDSQNFSYPPPQPQTYSYEQTANLRTSTPDFLKCFKLIYKGSTIPLNNMPQISPSVAITPDLPIEEPKDSLIMGDEHLSTIPEKESDELIKSSVKDLVPIPSEFEDTSGSDSECILPSCDNVSPINVYEKKSVTFSNPLFDSNDDFTSSDDESLYDKDRISSDEFFAPGDDIEFLLQQDPSTPTISVVSILEGFTDEPPLEENDDLFDLESKTNDWKKILYNAPIDDLIFDLGGDIDEIDAFLDTSTDIEDGYHDSKGDILYLESLLSNDTILSLPPKVFLDRDPRSLRDINDLKNMVKVFDPGIHETIFYSTYMLPFEDRHYLSFTYVIRNFLPYFTYPVNSSLPLSSESEDIIFDPVISAFHFSSLEPVAYEYSMIASDYEDSRAHGFVHRSIDLQSFACLYMGIQYHRSY